MALTQETPAKRESKVHDHPLLDLAVNIVAPTVILSKFSNPERLGPVNALLLSLAFPVAFILYKFVKERRASFFGIVGFVSVLLTGGLGLLKMEGFWFAVKEASVPTVFAAVVVLSLRTRTPLIRTFLYNDKIIDLQKVDDAIAMRDGHSGLDRLLARSTFYLAGSFLLSAVLNFALAMYLLKSPTGTPEFNDELAKMNAMSFPVITLPSVVTMMVTFRFFLKGLESLTGLRSEEIFKTKK